MLPQANARSILEQEIFAALAQDIATAAEALGAAATALAELDVYAALASLALDQGYVRPLIDQSLGL